MVVQNKKGGGARQVKRRNAEVTVAGLMYVLSFYPISSTSSLPTHPLARGAERESCLPQPERTHNSGTFQSNVPNGDSLHGYAQSIGNGIRNNHRRHFPRRWLTWRSVHSGGARDLTKSGTISYQITPAPCQIILTYFGLAESPPSVLTISVDTVS